MSSVRRTLTSPTKHGCDRDICTETLVYLLRAVAISLSVPFYITIHFFNLMAILCSVKRPLIGPGPGENDIITIYELVECSPGFFGYFVFECRQRKHLFDHLLNYWQFSTSIFPDIFQLLINASTIQVRFETKLLP